MRRIETGEVYSGEVPLELFQGRAFSEKTYLDRAVKIVLQGIQALSLSDGEEIRICSGYVLSKVRDLLRERGFKITQTKIYGKSQELAEREFIKSLVQLGVGDENVVSGMRSFNGFLSWIKEDLASRERFVKTGWPSWPRLRDRIENVASS